MLPLLVIAPVFKMPLVEVEPVTFNEPPSVVSESLSPITIALSFSAITPFPIATELSPFAVEPAPIAIAPPLSALPAIEPNPIAMELLPVAIEVAPIAIAQSPAFSPPAVEPNPRAVELTPLAVELTPVAVEKFPLAIDLTPVAVDSSPLPGSLCEYEGACPPKPISNKAALIAKNFLYRNIEACFRDLDNEIPRGI
jgi:hypothetical protein